MERLFIQGTDDTPEITFDSTHGIFEIKGRSLPEDVIEFYGRIFSWLEQYVSSPNETTILKVRVDYFNSASQKALNEIFVILGRILIKGKQLEVEWNYHSDDEEMLESGKEFAEITNVPFKFKNYI